jgi:hypothetical protein
MCFAIEDNVKHLFSECIKVQKIKEYIHDETKTGYGLQENIEEEIFQ